MVFDLFRSISFTFFTSGLAFFAMSVIYYFADMKKLWDGSPFYHMGQNSITIYIVHEVLAFHFPISFKNNGNHDTMLLSNVIGIASLIYLSKTLYNHHFFLKI